MQTQAATAVLSPGELEFAGHAKQFVTAEAPAEPEYVPAAQLVHPALPPVSLYVPAPHGKHGPPSGPECPALHVHADFPLLSSDPPHAMWLHRHPCSTVEQAALHPSPSTSLPSSHVSLPATLPSPHLVVHQLGSPRVQLNPHSIAHVALHPSPSPVLPSSHPSPFVTIPSPQISVQTDTPHARLVHAHPSSAAEQSALHPSPSALLPSSHVSLPASFPSAQRV